MGNMICCCRRRRRRNIPPATDTIPATPYLNPNPNYLYQSSDYCPPPSGTSPPPPYDHHHLHHYPPHIYQQPRSLFPGGRYPMMPPLPYVQYQKAVTIRNEVNVKKETLRFEPDPENPNRLLVSFTFDASMSGRITVVFFAKEEAECNLTATKKDTLPPITFDFEKGLGQKFIQPSGTGIDLTVFEESQLFKEAETDIYSYPLAIKAEAAPAVDSEEGNSGSANVQVTQVVYKKEKGEIKIEVVRQILWVNGSRYELQEIYGIGNSVDGLDEGKECVICLSEPRDTTVLPCRHMCMCGECAKVLRFQTTLCPICRQPVERFLEITVDGNNNGGK